MASKLKSGLSVAIKISIAVALIAYMLHSGHLDLSTLWDLMTPTNVALGLALVGINVALLTWRWLFLLRARGFQAKISYVSSLYLIGMFFNYALPGAVGGDVVKAFYLVRDHRERRMDAVLSILIDRILGLYTFFILTLFAIAIDFDFIMSHEKIRWVAMVCIFVFLGMTAFFAAAFSQRLQHYLGVRYLVKVSPRFGLIVRVLDAFQKFGRKRSVIFASIAVSLVAQAATLAFFYRIGWALGEHDVPFNAYLFSMPMGFIVTALPIAPAGVGVGQVAFHYLFQAYLGRATPLGSTAITAYQIALLCWALLGAFFFVRYRRPSDNWEIANVNQ